MFDLNIDQGSDYSLTIKIKTLSLPVDLTGFTFAGQVKAKFTDTSPLLTFAFSISNQVSNRGEVVMTLPKAATSALVLTEATTYLYDVEMTNLSSKVTRILGGNCTVLPEVTK